MSATKPGSMPNSPANSVKQPGLQYSEKDKACNSNGISPKLSRADESIAAGPAMGAAAGACNCNCACGEGPALDAEGTSSSRGRTLSPDDPALALSVRAAFSLLLPSASLRAAGGGGCGGAGAAGSTAGGVAAPPAA